MGLEAMQIDLKQLQTERAKWNMSLDGYTAAIKLSMREEQNFQPALDNTARENLKEASASWTDESTPLSTQHNASFETRTRNEAHRTHYFRRVKIASKIIEVLQAFLHDHDTEKVSLIVCCLFYWRLAKQISQNVFTLFNIAVGCIH
jgi:hypothetical protein